MELRHGKFFTVTTRNRLNLTVAAGETSPDFSAIHEDSEPIGMRFSDLVFVFMHVVHIFIHLFVKFRLFRSITLISVDSHID